MGIYAHIAGIDVVRDADVSFCAPEDKLRVPSGVSYGPANRKMMMRLFPELLRDIMRSSRSSNTRTCSLRI